MKDDEKKCTVADDRTSLRRAEEHINKLTCELKDREAEKAFYLKENEYLKETLRRLAGV